MRGVRVSILLCLLVVFTSAAEARDNGGASGYPRLNELEIRNLPPCLNNRGDLIDPNNEQVLRWKTSTPNQFHERGFITGTLVGVFNDRSSHLHLDVFIGQNGAGRGRDSDIELIYNKAFGKVQGELRPGMEVSACGDYITSNAPTGRYPASPVGAILHWIHKTMGGKHPPGFLVIDGRLYGQEDAPPRRRFDESFAGFSPGALLPSWSM